MQDELDAALRQPSIRLWRRLVRVTEGKRREVETTLAPLGLTMTEFDLLAVVRSLGRASQQDTAQRLLFSEANMSYHAKRLMARGLLSRETSGKKKYLSLTPAGQALVEQALPLIIEIHGQQFADLSDEELEQLRQLLRRLR